MSITRRAGFAALAAVGLALSGGAALAHDEHEGEATVPGIGPEARHEAVGAAIADWKRDVYKRHGYHARWRTAFGKEVDCDTHRLRGTTECEVEAVPTRE